MYNIAIIGAGASGLAAAIAAKRKNAGLSVLLIEALPRVGKKILATGNGRCNLTNLNASADKYNSGFVSDILSEKTPEYILEFFRSVGLRCVSDSEGRVYPMSNSAASVLDCLRFEAENLGVEILCETRVSSLNVENGQFIINKNIKAEKVIIAAGGKASPSQGSDGSGFELLKSLGHRITPVYPALVQLTVKENVKALKGVRVKANLTLAQSGRQADRSSGEVLFTDYGLSGIAVMDISRSVKNRNGTCFIDALPPMSEKEIVDFLFDCKKRNPDLSADNALGGILPKKFGQFILKICGIKNEMPLKMLRPQNISEVSGKIKNLSFEITGTNGFNNAQITVGGAKLNEFDSRTLESKKVRGLYAAGEVLDVDSVCGGFNLHWAWASGITAGESAAE